MDWRDGLILCQFALLVGSIIIMAGQQRGWGEALRDNREILDMWGKTIQSKVELLSELTICYAESALRREDDGK